MTKHLSEFGSLDDRAGQTRARAESSADSVRHAWLDGDVAVLLLRWRKNESRWEGLICGMAAHGPALAWVVADRLSPANQPAPATQPTQT